MIIAATFRGQDRLDHEGYVIHLYEDNTALFIKSSGHYAGKAVITNLQHLTFSVSDVELQNSALKKLS